MNLRTLQALHPSVLALAFAASMGGMATAQDQPPAALVEAGRKLFEHEWKPGEPLSPGGDGLGPSFNDVSCVACHFQGAIGGGGPIDKNVDMLSIPVPDQPPTLTEAQQLRDFHPGFITPDRDLVTSIVLHKFSLTPNYAQRREALLGKMPYPSVPDFIQDQLVRQHAEQPVQVRQFRGWTLARHQRNTPAMFGAGVIDRIPDSVISELAALQAKTSPATAGRIAPIGEIENVTLRAGLTPTAVRAGKFGWRGQVASLADFVLGACAGELGLQVPTQKQAMNPDHPDYEPPALDMNEEQCAALIAFVMNLPPPQAVIPADPQQLQVVMSGRATFLQIGCAACHLEDLANAHGIYSDLLLHDMGPELRDPMQAAPAQFLQYEGTLVFDGPADPTTATAPRVETRSGYPYGAPTTVTVHRNGGLIRRGTNQTGLQANQAWSRKQLPTNLQQEWRTPPLWGVRDSAPYLHDGRAGTLVEAIAWHGGQGTPSTNAFLNLATEKRLEVLEFLRTLRAPDVPN